jgi:transcriptional regulator GlxA family with amidase domain
MELSWVSYQWHGSHESTGAHEIDTLLQRFDASPVVYVDATDARQVSTLWSTLGSIAEDDRAIDTQISLLVSALIIAIAQTVASAGGDWAPTPVGQGSGLRETTLRLALRYIEDNLDRDLSVPEIAAYVAVSPRQLSRIFRDIVNTSPAEYVMRARLDRAAMLLRSTDRAIKDVAAQVGLPDIHHFTRVFARYAGAPPAAFRQGKVDISVPKRQNPGRLL